LPWPRERGSGVFGRGDAQPGQPRFLGASSLARGDPAANDSYSGCDSMRLPPVAGLPGRLQEQQAGSGAAYSSGGHPPRGANAGDPGRIGGEQRQAKAVLSLDRPVASAGVATYPAEDGCHMAAELGRGLAFRQAPEPV